MAVFFILIEILHSGVFTNQTILMGLLTFGVMVAGGIALGIGFGMLFSKVIKHIKNNEAVEITLTVILAHVTFISAGLISQYVSIGDFKVEIS